MVGVDGLVIIIIDPFDHSLVVANRCKSIVMIVGAGKVCSVLFEEVDNHEDFICF